MKLIYKNYPLTEFELDQIRQDAVRFADEYFPDLRDPIQEFLDEGGDEDDLFNDVLSDTWSDFEYESFTFGEIHKAYPEDINSLLPWQFAQDLDEFTKAAVRDRILELVDL